MHPPLFCLWLLWCPGTVRTVLRFETRFCDRWQNPVIYVVSINALDFLSFCHLGHWKCKNDEERQQQPLWQIHRDRLWQPLSYHWCQHENISAGEITSGVSGEHINAHSPLHECTHTWCLVVRFSSTLRLIPSLFTVCYLCVRHHG